MATLLLSLGMLLAQDPGDEARVSFTFQEASVEAVLRTVSRVTGWIFVLETPSRGSITACSDATIPVTRCLDFLNASLGRHGLFVLNPADPRLPLPGDTLRVIDLGKALRAPTGVRVGLDPRGIPISGEPRTQILPLKSAGAADAAKDFGDVFRRLLGEGGQLAISSFSNSILVSGTSEGIHRVAEIFSVIDQTAAVQLQLVVFPLQYTDAVETAKTLNDVFKHDEAKVEPNGPRLPGFLRGLEAAPAAPKSPAHESVKITPDSRSNSLIAGASEENMAVIRRLVEQLDRPSSAMNTYVVPMVYTDSASIAALLNTLWNSKSASSGRSVQPRSDGTLAPGQAPPATTPSSSRDSPRR